MPNQTRGLSECIVEGCEKPNDGCKGMCMEHYRRQRNYGIAEKQRRPKGKGKCTVEGCTERDTGGLGLCRLHYARQRHHGHVGLVREGNKRNHPYYSLWFDRKSNNGLAPEWLDFKRFIADIGEMPEGGDHYLIRLDGTRPYGPDNFKWEAHLRRCEGEPHKEWWARKWAAQNAKNPGFQRKREMKRRYGLTLDQVAEMEDEHAGLCAICQRPETSIDGKSGTVKRLAIDHCHTSGKVRGLLCWRCNSALGKVQDSTDLLRAMIAYLERHEET